MPEEMRNANNKSLEATTKIIEAYLSNNQLPASELPAFIASVHRACSALLNPNIELASEKSKPAISIAKSVNDDFIVCLEDGKKLKMLKRYLRSNFGLSPEEYRKKWNLPADYPMVAPNYAIKRSEFAKKIGLGRGVRSGN